MVWPDLALSSRFWKSKSCSEKERRSVSSLVKRDGCRCSLQFWKEYVWDAHALLARRMLQ